MEDLYIPGGFARVASPKMMSDCHMLRMNVCDAGRHAGTQRHEKGLTFIRVRAWLARARYGCRTDCLLWYPRRFVTQAGTHAETRKRVDMQGITDRINTFTS